MKKIFLSKKAGNQKEQILRILISTMLVISLLFPVSTVFSLADSIPQNNSCSGGCLADDPGLLNAQILHYPESLYATLPDRIDLTNEFPPVRNQESQGSCVAWSVAYALKTHQEYIDHYNWDITVPEHQFSPAYVFNQLTVNGEGLIIGQAIQLIIDQGVCTLASFPYDPNDFTTQPNEKQRDEAAKYRASNNPQVLRGSSQIKAHLATGDGVVIGVNVYPDFDQLSPSNPVYDSKEGEKGKDSHAICLIGYDDSLQAFKFINSHGTDYGLDGYGWISYDLVDDPDVNHHNAGTGFVMTDVMTSISLSVTFDANGGSGAPSKKWVFKNDSITIPSYAPTRFGYNFLGWSTDRTATAPTYKPNNELLVEQDTTLYAVWSSSPAAAFDQETTVTIPRPGSTVMYSFTPTSNGIYQFNSACNTPLTPYVDWYYTDGTPLEPFTHTADAPNFSSSYLLEAGKTYYFKIGFENLSQTGSYTFQIADAAVSELFMDGLYRFDLAGTDFCMDAVNFGLEPSTEVELFPYNNQSNQKWTVTRDNEGYYSISPLYNPEQCLTSIQNYPVLLNKKYDSSSQKWKIQQHGEYLRLIPKSDTSSVLAPADVTSPEILDRLISTNNYRDLAYRDGFLWKATRVDGQQDTVQNVPAGTFRIQNVNSSLYLQGQNTLTQNTYADDDNQIWVIRVAGENGYRYLSPACRPDQYLTYLPELGRCTLMPLSGASNQKWQIVTGEDGYYKLKLMSHPGHVLVVQNAFTHPGADIIIYGDNGSSNGKWIITSVTPRPIVQDGVYTIQNVNSDLYFDACNFGTEDGTRILQWSYNGGSNQKFYIRHRTGGYYTLSPLYAPDLYLAAFDDGKVKLTEASWKEAALWRILKNPDGSYRFSPKSDLNLAAVVQYASTEVGADLILYEDNNTTNGWWNLDFILSATEIPPLESSMYQIKNKQAGLNICYSLEDSDGRLNLGKGDFAYWGVHQGDGYYSFQQYKYGNLITVADDGITIITGSSSDPDASLWKIMDDGRIYSKKYPTKVLAVVDDSTSLGARLTLVDAGSSQSEEWEFIR